MPHPQLSDKEIAERAQSIYQQQLRSRVEADDQNIGKIIVIDVQTGDYEIDDISIVASDRLRARHPHGMFYAMRIGYDTVYGFGAAPRRVKP